MLSRLLKSARSFLIDTPQIEIVTPSPVCEILEETMVATRRKPVEAPADDDLNEDNSIHVDIPTSSSKKKGKRAKPEDTPELSAEEQSLPPSTKRRKTLPLREKDGDSVDGDMQATRGVKTHPVVEIPARKATPPKGDADGVPSVGTSEKPDDPEQRDVASNKKHHRFGSEDLDEAFFSTARESNEGGLADSPIVLSDEESEKSDDAPEAIGIQEAAQHIKSKDREAAKVFKE
jgi:hypothetical protein